MGLNRRTALQTVERQAWGGSSFDSLTHAAMFRTYKPHNFGLVTSKLFSAEQGQHLLNKKFTYLTVAKKNVYVLPDGVDDYEWFLESDTDVDFRITEYVDNGTYPGKGKMRFKIRIDRDWLHEPVLLKTENANLPLIRIIGYPSRVSTNSFEYVCELQTGDMMTYLPAEYLQPNRRLIRVSTAVSDELNQKFGPDQYGEMFKLQSWTGNFANKVEFSDKFIRLEIGCRTDNRQMYKGYKDEYAIGVGYVYKQEFKNNKGEKFEAGVFITKAEARLLERTEMDREMNMEFGQLEKTTDPETGRVMKVAPGWRQIAKDGHYYEHNGSLTLSDIYEFISNIFVTRRAFNDRKIILATGEGGAAFFSALIANEATLFQYIDTHFIRNVSSMFHENSLEFGSQFVSIKFPMGYVVQVFHDPIKDDRKLFPEKAPGTNRTVESFAMDIFDFGATDQKAFDANRPENITCVMQGGVESYYTVSNVYDFQSGAIKDGSNAYSNNKMAGIYREMSGGLCVWDTTRVGRIAFNPYANLPVDAIT